LSNLSIIILAAGAGTRMKSSTPKVLHKVSGKEMLYHIVKESKKVSDDVHVVLYHQAPLVKETLEGYFDDLTFHIQDHENYPGTGGAVMGVEPKNENVLVLNGDMPLVISSELKTFENSDASIVMGVLNLDNPSGYGRVVIDKDSKVQKIVEHKDANEDELKITSVNSGVYLFKKSFLKEYLPQLSNNNSQKEYYITDLVEFAVSDKHIVEPLFVSEENFQGVNSKVELAKVETIHQDRIKKELLKNGVIMHLPDTIYIEDGVKIEGETTIESCVSIYGDSKIKSSHIKSNSVIESSYIKESVVGPLARVRPNSEIIDSKIGNFVEIKKSTLRGVKAGHLSYLGDSNIGHGTNIGAGTITCNYDGKKKHQTTIGKNVFVGSDTKIVAPVNIEDDVMIGAGSVVTKDVSKGSLAISREPLKIIKDFYYKFFNESSK
jgi:bifunctional UDP-N-acetylglucosamine pyrophosphorylase/glucosamine-1-phosphate N-acetyltransferase